MNRVKLVIASAFAVMAIAFASPAFGASPHFKKGGEPVCTVVTNADGSKTVQCSGALAGLGNEDLIIQTNVGGLATFQCGTPGNANLAPGQNKFPVSQSGTTTIPTVSIKNGSVMFTTNPVTASAPENVSAKDAGCPNRNWQVVGSSVLVSSITLTIKQGGQTLFTCSASSADGLTGTVPLAC